MKSFPTTKEASEILKKMKEVYAKGRVNLTKFTSNKAEILKAIPEEHRKKNIKDRDLALGSLPEDKKFGVEWNIENDTIGFQIKLADN